MPRIIPANDGLGQCRSSFLREVLGPSAADDAILSAALEQLGDVSFEQLRTLLALTLDNLEVLGTRECAVLRLYHSQARPYTYAQTSGFLYPVDPALYEARFLISSPSSPAVTWVQDSDFWLVRDAAAAYLFFPQVLAGDTGLETRTVPRAVRTIVEGTGATFDPGTAPEDLPDPDMSVAAYVAAVAASDLARRTVVLDPVLGEVVLTLTAGQPTAVRTWGPPVDATWVGRRLRVADPDVREIEILSVTAGGGLILRSAIIGGPQVRALVVSYDAVTAREVGSVFEVLADPFDPDDASNQRFTIIDVPTPMTVVLGTPPSHTVAVARAYRVVSPAYDTVTHLYAPGSRWDVGGHVGAWCAQMGFDLPPTERTKQALQGALLVYLRGPSAAHILSLTSLAAGIPVIATPGEVHVRTQRGTITDYVYTNAAAYAVPHDLLRADLERVSDPPYAFAVYESLAQVAQVVDTPSDPTWYYGRTVPAQVSQVYRGRAASPQAFPAGLTATRLAGDPGTFVGADWDGRVLQDEIRHYRGAFRQGLSTLVFPDERLFASQGNCLVVYKGRNYRALTVSVATGTLEVRSDFPLDDVRTYAAHAAVANTLTITIPPGGEPLTAQDEGLLAYADLDLVRLVRVHSATRVTVEGVTNPVAVLGSATLLLAWDVYLVERGPLQLSVPFYAMSWAAPNMARVSITAEAVQSSLLTGPLRTAVEQGTLAHALVIVENMRRLFDPVHVLDGGLRLTLTTPGHGIFGVLARYSIGGQWSDFVLGTCVALGCGALAWEQRWGEDQMTTLPADPDELHFDAGTATSVWVQYSAEAGWTAAEVDVYGWDGVRWAYMEALSFTPAAPIVQFDGHGMLLALQLRYTDPVTWGVAIGAQRDEIQHTIVANPAHDLVVQTTQDDDAVLVVGLMMQQIDVGRQVILTYPEDPSQSWERVSDVAYIAQIVSPIEVRLVAEDLSAYAARRTQASVGAYLLGHAGWGVTSLRLDSPIPGSAFPLGAASRQALMRDLPVTYSRG